MTSIPDLNHTFQIIQRIPSKDYDPDEVCLLSHMSHEELNDLGQVARFNCNGVAKYLELEHCLLWLDHISSKTPRCPTCRGLLNLHSISELRINKLTEKQDALNDLLEKSFTQAKQIELTGSKVQDYILLFSFHKENTFEPLKELLRVNLNLAKLKLERVEHQIANFDQLSIVLEDTEEYYQKSANAFVSLQREKQELLSSIARADSYHCVLVEDLRKESENFERALKFKNLSNGELLDQSKTLLSLFAATAGSAFVFLPLVVPGFLASIAAMQIKSIDPLKELVRRMTYNPNTVFPGLNTLKILQL